MEPVTTTAATVEVPLEPLCTLIEQAIRGGLYMGTPVYDAWEAMPDPVRLRLCERRNEQTERFLAAAKASNLHREGQPHDESICVDCAIKKAEADR